MAHNAGELVALRIPDLGVGMSKTVVALIHPGG